MVPIVLALSNILEWDEMFDRKFNVQFAYVKDGYYRKITYLPMSYLFIKFLLETSECLNVAFHTDEVEDTYKCPALVYMAPEDFVDAMENGNITVECMDARKYTEVLNELLPEDELPIGKPIRM